MEPVVLETNTGIILEKAICAGLIRIIDPVVVNSTVGRLGMHASRIVPGNL
jgi:hypothetical protein